MPSFAWRNWSGRRAATAGGVGATWIGRATQAGTRVSPGVAMLDEEGRSQQVEGFEHRW